MSEMSRQDAIDYNKNLKMYMKISDKQNPCKFLEENYIALDMAIEALEEMSVEEYRQRLMDVFHRTDHDELLTYVVMPKEEEFKSLEYILRQYKFEPRLHGEWIIHRNKQGAHIYSVCSICNVPHLDTDFPNFCENCGSDNRKKEDKPHGS